MNQVAEPTQGHWYRFQLTSFFGTLFKLIKRLRLNKKQMELICLLNSSWFPQQSSCFRFSINEFNYLPIEWNAAISAGPRYEVAEPKFGFDDHLNEWMLICYIDYCICREIIRLGWRHEALAKAKGNALLKNDKKMTEKWQFLVHGVPFLIDIWYLS